MPLFNVITAAIGILFLASLVFLIRRDHLHIRYSLWWLSVAIVVALFGIFPGLNDRIAALLGISYPPIFPVVIAVLLLLSRLFLLDLENSSRRTDLTRLTQRLALLDQRLRELQSQRPDARNQTDD